MRKLTPLAKTAKVTSASHGIYIHFPWCLQKCPYCDFLSVAAERSQIPQQPYTQAVIRELAERRSQLGALSIHSVFFGGGTPSLWQAQHIAQVLQALAGCFQMQSELEVTVECNPSSFSESYARQLLEAGVGRVSLGVQGLDPGRLRFLGRLHDGAQALAAVRQALDAGLPSVSADLIYGVYDQAPEQACREIRQVASLGISHLSAYALTIEPQTPFGARHRKGRLPLLPDEQVADSFQQVSQTLAELGFEHYEISNFAKPGARSRHNTGYWRGEPYLGLGCGAWGTLQNGSGSVRYRNTVVPERYLTQQHWPSPFEAVGSADAVGPGKPYQQLEPLDASTLLTERLMLGLRLLDGVDLQQLERQLGLEVRTPRLLARIEKLQRAGRLELDGSRLRIPRRAWLLADGTIAELV